MFDKEFTESLKRFADGVKRLHDKIKGIACSVAWIDEEYKYKSDRYPHERQGWRTQRFYMTSQVIDRKPKRIAARTRI
ncbi:hypothetical protein [Aureibacillus halotolerans]|uniref:Uncharacterized protein n=1 Tax=Aureibacillus halotolerans TaxID=1508390 RepID=A0A4R6TUD8_9BACI|nr:hypothetical protein [Aureibacillus halotolerans]TDQ35264.1 hypothetical protein EV213_12251 [Aureibacillus halotolerans]